jgi:tetratricopeptide (TPR) repeat protein
MSIEIERERKTEEDEVMSIGYLNLGMAYYDLCMFNSALFWSERMAFQCQRKILPSDHPTLSVTYSSISSIYSSMGDHALARSNLERALNIQKNTLPPLHFNTHAILNKLALECQLLGEYDSALNYYRQEQDVILNAASFDPKLFVENYLWIAAVYDCRGDDKKALFYNKMALKNLSRKKPKDRLNLATVYNNLGMLFINMKYYKYAMKNLIKALILEQRFLEPRHQLLITTMSNMGMTYERCGLLKKALYLHRKVLNIRKHTLGSVHPDLATTLDNIGVIYYKVGKFKAVIKFYQRALRINTIALPMDHPATVYICDHLDDVYHRLGQQKLARRYYKDPENMILASLRDRQFAKESVNKMSSVDDQSIVELNSFTRDYLASIDDSISFNDDNMTTNLIA